MYPDRLKNKVALITGASSGIGFATAKRLACEGTSVILFARRKELLEKCVKEITDNGGKACYFVGDVTNDDDVSGCIKQCLETFGTIHILINNAGMELVRSFAMTSYEEWNKIFDVNLGGVIRFTQKVQKIMIKTGGVIINISSICGLVGVAGYSVYSMTKGGLIALTKSLALELAPRNIRVNAIAAGMVETDLMDRVFRNLSSDQVERIKSMHPLGFGKPEDVSAGIAFLASDDAKWITGTVLVIDGGYTAA